MQHLRRYASSRRRITLHVEGTLFFRAYNGVIEVIKFCYEPHGARYDLLVGMHSMYSELKAQWFTSRGCIPSFSVMQFIDVYDTSISVPEGFQVSPPVSLMCS